MKTILQTSQEIEARIWHMENVLAWEKQPSSTARQNLRMELRLARIEEMLVQLLASLVRQETTVTRD